MTALTLAYLFMGASGVFLAAVAIWSIVQSRRIIKEVTRRGGGK